MGITDVVENLRSLKKTVKKPITAFRETVHNAYTKAYVGSPERVDEFYNYIKVYTPNKHNDLCMMSITADINRFSMIPDKNTFFHVLKLERHFDRMIAARKQPDVTGDMAIQILSGHNSTFMGKYRRYKIRSTAKELKRRNQRFKALNVRRHTQLPDSGNTDSCVYRNRTSMEMPFLKLSEELKDSDSSEDEEPTNEILQAVIAALEPQLKEEEEKIPEKKNVSIVCELTKPETVVAAPVPVQSASVSVPVKENESLAISAAKASIVQKKRGVEKSMMAVTKKHDAKFKVAKSVTVKKAEKPATEATVASTLLEDVMEQLNLDEKKKETPKPKIIVEFSDSDSHEEFDKCDTDSDDGSDIEELEKIEDKDVDALEYEMI
uniref:SPK domain-containing protein n=1 Tax=Caenorhabditis tropicalis TaxID=1561998 RepID=A0A1I7SZ26_9PELO